MTWLWPRERRKRLLRSLSMAGLTAACVHIHNDFCYAVNAASCEYSTLFDCRVAGRAGKFDDAVMHLDTH